MFLEFFKCNKISIVLHSVFTSVLIVQIIIICTKSLYFLAFLNPVTTYKKYIRGSTTAAGKTHKKPQIPIFQGVLHHFLIEKKRNYQ